IQIGHWPDRYNHSAADSLDKVDPQELRRSAAIAASVLCAASGTDGGTDDPARSADLARLVARWTAQRMVACLPSPAEVGHAYDPFHPRHLDRIVESGIGALRSLREAGAAREALGVHESWLNDLRSRL